MSTHGDGLTEARRVKAAWVFVAVLAVMAVALWWPRLTRGEVSVAPSATPASAVATSRPTPPPTPTPTASMVPTATPTPSATATSTEVAGQTVLFQGGPATGPWQQLGTVAEITHPDAPTTARISYLQGWSDPAGENQSDELWDQLVAEVARQVVELGEPVDRPAFGGSPGSQALNSSGGMEDIYFEDEVFTAYWAATFEDEEGVGEAYFLYLIDFDGEVVDRGGPVVFREDGERDFRDNVRDFSQALREWAAERGFVECERC